VTVCVRTLPSRAQIDRAIREMELAECWQRELLRIYRWKVFWHWARRAGACIGIIFLASLAAVEWRQLLHSLREFF